MVSTTMHHHPPLFLSRFFSSKSRSFHSKSLIVCSSQPIIDSTWPPQSQILSIRHFLLSCHVSATQLADSYLARLKLMEPHLKSFFHVSDKVLHEAESLDDQIQRNENIGPLARVLVGVKDNICTVDVPSTAGSKVLEKYRPPFDAASVVLPMPNSSMLVLPTTTAPNFFNLLTGGSFGLSVKPDG